KELELENNRLRKAISDLTLDKRSCRKLRLGRPPIAPTLEKRIREALAAPGRPGVRVLDRSRSRNSARARRITGLILFPCHCYFTPKTLIALSFRQRASAGLSGGTAVAAQYSRDPPAMT